MERDGPEQAPEPGKATDTAQDVVRRAFGERIAALESQRRSAEEAGDQAAQASVLRKLGDLHRSAGANDSAREAYSKARYLLQLAGNAEGAAVILLTLGSMESRLRRFDAAARFFHEAYDLFQRLAVPDKAADALLSEADAMLAMGKQPGAVERIEAAGALFAKLDDTLGQAHTAFRLGMIALQDESESADEHLELAARLFGDHVSRDVEDVDVSLPGNVSDSRRYPPFVMQRFCLRERQKLIGDEAAIRPPNRYSSTASIRKPKAIETAPSDNNMLITWVGVGILVIGMLVILLPKVVGEVTLFGRIADWFSGMVALGTAVHIGMGLLGAMVAIVGARQLGISAPVVLLALAIGVGMIFHEVSRGIFANLGSAQGPDAAGSGAAKIEDDAILAGRAAAAKQLVTARADRSGEHLDAARSGFNQSYDLAKGAFDSAGQVRALEELFKLETDKGTLQDQLVAAERLYNDLRGFDDARGREVLEQIVSLSTRLGDQERLRDAHVKLLAYYERSGDKVGEVTALLALAALDRDAFELERSYEWYRRAHGCYQSLRDSQGQVGTLLAMGEIDARLGRGRRAYGRYYHAFAMYRELDDEAGQAAMLLQMGALEEASERYEEAIAAFRQSQRIYSSLGDKPGEAMAALRFGSTQVSHGNQRQAREGFLRSLELYLELGDIGGQARAHLGLGHHWLNVGEREDATRHYEEARALYARERDPRGQLAALREMALIAHKRGSDNAAQGRFEEARRVTRDVADPSVRASLLLSAGDLALSLERRVDAESTYREALALYQDIGDDSGQRAANERLSRVAAAG